MVAFIKNFFSKNEVDINDNTYEEEYISLVMKKTGWGRKRTIKRITEARKRTGCTYKEYYMYKFYKLNKKIQNEFFLVSQSRKIREKYDVNTELARVLNNKELANNYFEEYLGRAWCVNTKIELEEFNNKFKNSAKVIYKPVRGSKGNGVQIFDIDNNRVKSVYEELIDLPKGVVEECVVQHSDLSGLSPTSVNTVRIVSVSSMTHPVTSDGKYMDIAYAALRIGGTGAIVDNFHSGGMVAAIDMNTGELVTDAADEEGNVYHQHPATGKPIRGFKVPYFKEALELVNEAIIRKKTEGLLGWDIAITENGPVLIEVNLKPAVVLLSMPYVAEKKGMKHVMDKYLY